MRNKRRRKHAKKKKKHSVNSLKLSTLESIISCRKRRARPGVWLIRHSVRFILLLFIHTQTHTHTHITHTLTYMITIIDYFLVSKNLTFNMREKWANFTRAQLLFSFLYKHEKELDFFLFLFFVFKQSSFSYNFTKKNKKKKPFDTQKKCNHSFGLWKTSEKGRNWTHTYTLRKKHLFKI